MIYGKIEPKKEFKAKFVPGFRHDIRRRVPHVEKAKKMLGWEAKVRLEDGLDDVVEWLKKTYKKGKAGKT